MLLIGEEQVGNSTRKVLYVRCECEHPEHYAEITWFEGGPNDNEDPEFHFGIGMSKCAPWHKRFWFALRYVLGRSTTGFGPYDSTVVRLDEMCKLVDALEDRLKRLGIVTIENVDKVEGDA